jgi:hypothetical protein
MSSVYAGSALNFAATASVNGDGGCFSDRDPIRVYPCRAKFDEDDLPALLVNPNLWEEGVENSPLARRAWVLQEIILAPRRCISEQLSGSGNVNNLARTRHFLIGNTNIYKTTKGAA